MDALKLEDENLASEILDLVPQFYYFISSLEPIKVMNPGRAHLNRREL
jgi:hypothetical protein